MGLDDLCNTGLVLQLGFPSLTGSEPKPKSIPIAAHKISEPSLTLRLSGETYDQINRTVTKKIMDCSEDLYRQNSGDSSLVCNVKREREIEVEETERVSLSRISNDEDDDVGPNGRKKLRLTKAQSALLEESFKIHSTLNPKQKQELARELKLRPRQVEVWFQNRRARTKLKQTEVDCESLKKCCETLTEENRRLRKELHELKALNPAQPPLYMQLPAATLTMCPSCERTGGSVAHETVAPKPHFYNHFTNPSAAC